MQSWIGRHPSSLFLSLSAPNPYSQLDHKSCLPCCDATHPIDTLTLSLNCLAGASHSFTLYLHNTYILADLPLKIQPLMILNWPLKRFLKVFCKELFDFILLDHWGRIKTRTTVPTHPTTHPPKRVCLLLTGFGTFGKYLAHARTHHPLSCISSS